MVFTINWHQINGIYFELPSTQWYLPSIAIKSMVFTFNWHQTNGIDAPARGAAAGVP